MLSVLGFGFAVMACYLIFLTGKVKVNANKIYMVRFDLYEIGQYNLYATGRLVFIRNFSLFAVGKAPQAAKD